MDGFGQWGGGIPFPELLHEGDEIWFRAYVYFPDGFNFWTDAGHMKMMRIHTRAAGGGSGSNEGYFDVLVSGDLTIGSELGTGFYSNNPNWSDVGETVPTGVWQAYEMYVRLSSTSEGAMYRVWQNGTLVFEDSVSPTLKSVTSEADLIWIFSYWNGTAPATQNAYLDDIVVTTGQPTTTDATGNPFIGLGY